MKRSTDEIRYFILNLLNEKGRMSIEKVRQKINTSLQTVLNNAKDLETFGFIKIKEINRGKRKYRELEIKEEGRKFLKKLEKKFKNSD
jgi:DNA-binding Lrp family transcriptional regulator